jgi:hypothetical protein
VRLCATDRDLLVCAADRDMFVCATDSDLLVYATARHFPVYATARHFPVCATDRDLFMCATDRDLHAPSVTLAASYPPVRRPVASDVHTFTSFRCFAYIWTLPVLASAADCGQRGF